MKTPTSSAKPRLIVLPISIVISSFISLMALSEVHADERESASRRLGNDLFVAGAEARLAEEVRGDAVMAGREVTTAGMVRGDLVVAGGQLTLRGSVDKNLYAAGGQVRLDGKVAGNARIGGGRIEIAPDAEVRGGVSIGGGRVGIDGHVGRYLQVAAGSTRIDGRIDGDVDVAGGELNVGPTAVVAGSLTFRGPKPAKIDPGAQIRGGAHHVPEAHKQGKDLRTLFGVAAGLWLIGWIIVGGVLLALWPRFSRKVSEVAAGHPWRALLTGFVVLVGMPIAFVLLMVSIIGIPMGLLVLGLYFVILPLGYLASAVAIGDWVLPRIRKSREILTRHRVLTLLAVLIALFLAGGIPVVGKLIGLLIVLMGVGSLVIASFTRYRRDGTAVAA